MYKDVKSMYVMKFICSESILVALPKNLYILLSKQ